MAITYPITLPTSPVPRKRDEWRACFADTSRAASRPQRESLSNPE
jgi:hypothetical protein